MVQQLGLCASTSRVHVPSLVGELKSHKLHSAAKKKVEMQKNVCVMFIAVGKRTEEFVRKRMFSYTHIYIYVHICMHMPISICL